jgi:hypothetical protein
VALVSSLVLIVVIHAMLVHVADEVDNGLQGLRPGFRVCLGVSKEGEKLLCLADHSITVGAFPASSIFESVRGISM